MTLADLIDMLDTAGLDFQAEDVLDALWLASCGKQLSLHRGPVAPFRPGDGRRSADEGADGKTAPETAVPPRAPARRNRAGQSGASSETRVYAGGLPSVTDRTVKAAPVAIPAGQALGNRLALMRSLRPLTRRWPSRRDLQIDEEQTARTSAEMGFRGSFAIHPVFRPSEVPWYDADVVIEDDPVIELWNETVRDFCQVLRDTGAFRVVQSWRLRMVQDEDIEADADPRVTIESPTGVRRPIRAFARAGTRRLIFFVTHGSSLLWRDGSYAKILSPWLREASLVLLHMLPPERWQHTYLGESHGLCLAEEPGAPAARLRAEPFWWQLPDADISTLLKLPAVTLDPAALGDWASMQMGRGRRTPLFLLDGQQQHDPAAIASRLVSMGDFERAIAQLREASQEAFLLGVYLSPSYFTIPVARLVQEAKFGKASNPSQLGELFLSGLIFAKTGTSNGASEDQRYFGFWPQAREILMQSLREEDARSIAADLENRVSRYIEEISGRTVTFRGLVPRENGTYDLPEWAQPFATVANSLLGLPNGSEGSADLVKAFVESSPPEIVAAAAQALDFQVLLDPRRARSGLWEAMTSFRLLEQSGDGRSRFAPGVAEQLKQTIQRLLAGTPILWVDDHPRSVEREGRTLRDWGATIELAGSTEAAIAALRERNFALVISDWSRRRDAGAGLTLLRACRELSLKTPIIIYAGRNDSERRSLALENGAFAYTTDQSELYGSVLKAFFGRSTPPTATVKPPPPGIRSQKFEAARATVRMYRQGFGDCFLFTLKGGHEDYRILVNCGVLMQTPNATATMTKIADDIVAVSSGRIETLIVTERSVLKVSGFRQAANSFARLRADEVVLGWWENPDDPLARSALRKSGAVASNPGSMAAITRLGEGLRFLNPKDGPLILGDTGARLHFLGTLRDRRVLRLLESGSRPALDFAIELADGDVLLFVNTARTVPWVAWQQISWQSGDGAVTDFDMLSRVVFCKTRLLSSDEEVFRGTAMPLMPNLRIVAAPLDRATIAKLRWKGPSALDDIDDILRSRGGSLLVSDAKPPAPSANVTVTPLWFDMGF